MSPRILFCRLIVAAFFCLVCRLSWAQDVLSPVIIKSEGSQFSFSLRKEFLPGISHMSLDVFTVESKRVHQEIVPADQSLVWTVKEMSRYTEGSTDLYLCVITLKPVNGELFVLPGWITQVDKKLEFRLWTERPNNLPGPSPEVFHKSLTQTMPNNGAAWFFYALAICEKQRDGLGFFTVSLSPPPPPPPAAPGARNIVLKEIPRSKEEQNQIDEEERQWKAKQAALERDMKIAQPLFLKAVELTDDCQIKDTAMAYLAAIASQLGDDDGHREWLLKRIESSCATNSAKAESYYALGVKQWECAYTLTGKYANKKAADPFHFRAITNLADKNQFDNCAARAAEFIEKALEAQPDYVDALFYKSLIFRELQKTTADLAKRKKLEAEATKTNNRAAEVMKQRDQQK